MKKKLLIVIEGPTASGKTALSIQLAKKYNSVIISADSRQFYKEMTIGTAKPSIEEQDGIKHYFIDSHSILEPLTSGQYELQAIKILEEEFKNHDIIFLVGGSGMFIDALCNGLDEIPTDIQIRNLLMTEFHENGLQPLLEELEEKDFVFYNSVDKNNPVRIIRALEVIRITNKPFSSFRNKKGKDRFFNFQKFVIDLPRETLYNRINARVDIMLKNGLVEEVKSLESFKTLQPLNTVGYSELYDYFDGKIDYETAIELIKQNTRRYAKRQLTWFRKDSSAIWIQNQKIEEQIDKISSFIELNKES